MISQIFVLNSLGDIVVSKLYRRDTPEESASIFHHHVKNSSKLVLPCVNIDGINYIFIQKYELVFVLVSPFNISPFLGLDILNRIITILCDILGGVNEILLRKNLSIIYEILEEIIDFGYIQETNTSLIHSKIRSNPESDFDQHSVSESTNNQRTVNPQIANQPIGINTNKIPEGQLFLSLFEDLQLFGESNGDISSSTSNGYLEMKSFGLTNSLLNVTFSKPSFNIDDGRLPVIQNHLIHTAVDSSNLENGKFSVPCEDGKKVLWNYQALSPDKYPLKVNAFIEHNGTSKLELNIRLRFIVSPNQVCNNVEIKFPIPRATQSVSFALSNSTGQKAEYVSSIKKCVWKIQTVDRSCEFTLSVKMSLSKKVSDLELFEINEIVSYFDICSGSALGPEASTPSGMFLQQVQIDSPGALPPQRWIRTISHVELHTRL
eukprot:TRINITY_DN3341_c0_g1_i1.p1 TRINITY_DN3341_c0_g1~~TRINITY_DN3341_c0_g1_i1.p1  ORF type:complete len:446 (+),score=111.69 TRINITY_DN3341_c0_g1_i1:37-1338(+)